MRGSCIKPIRKVLIHLLLSLLLSGCAIVKPHLDYQADTPIDWGLGGGFESAITVLSFDTGEFEPKWGVYAAKRMQEYLLEEKAFRRVVYGDKEPVTTPYVLKGEINHLYYGGTFTPTKVYVTIRIIERSDGQTRFMRKGSAECEKRAFRFDFLSRLYVSSPYPEELLNGILKTTAKDIARRTTLADRYAPEQ
jgi:hypothetical protein